MLNTFTLELSKIKNKSRFHLIKENEINAGLLASIRHTHKW